MYVKLYLVTLPGYYNADGWGEQSIDWARIRNLANPEPTQGAWGIEENQAALIFTREFASGNQLWDASSELGVELSLNLNNPVSLNMSRRVGGVGGGPPSGLAFLECFVSISVNDSSALQGINIIIHYTDSKVAELGLNERTLAIWYWNETLGNWIQLPSTVDTISNTVTAYTTHLTNFAILGTFIPQGALSPYILLALFFLLMPSGLNPLVYLALGLVVVAVLSVLGLGLRSRREEQAAEVEAPTRYERVPTSRSPAKYTPASTPRGSRESAPEPKMVLKVRKITPEGEALPTAAPKRAKPTKTRRTAENLEAKRVALKDLMQEINARFDAGKLTPDEYREIYTKYSTKLASIDKKLGRLKIITPVLGKWCCLFCGFEIQGNTKFCPNCGGARLKCSVCQTEIVTEEQYVKCPYCGVLSHKDHLFEWIKMRGTCPNCNKKLSLQNET
nr:hypothetical protein [Candidatus Freyarchaeota archaeon]